MIRLLKLSGSLNTKIRILSVLYFLVGILYIMLPVLPVSIPHLPVKALIIPMLIIIFKVALQKRTSLSDRLIFIALFFSWAGDVALGITWHPEIMFMAGLVFFLLTHIFYFIVFIRTQGRNLAPGRFLYSIIPLLMYGFVLLYIMLDDLGEMKIPVILYTSVILAMVAAAINRMGKVNPISFYVVLAGALLFLSSDSMLAINKFSHPFQLASPLIMFTYIAGQYLIVMGYVSGTGVNANH
jgi:uncharacterized membrane protein YhhN